MCIKQQSRVSMQCYYRGKRNVRSLAVFKPSQKCARAHLESTFSAFASIPGFLATQCILGGENDSGIGVESSRVTQCFLYRLRRHLDTQIQGLDRLADRNACVIAVW